MKGIVISVYMGHVIQKAEGIVAVIYKGSNFKFKLIEGTILTGFCVL